MQMQTRIQDEIEVIRGFNRYYTNVLGLLDQDILDSDYSLSEARILNEIEREHTCTSKHLADTLLIDAGYLSRVLTRLQKLGLIERKKSDKDGRAYDLSLTSKGEAAAEMLDSRSDEQIRFLISPLPDTARSQLAQSMTTIEGILTGGKNIQPDDVKIRHNIKPGDVGYITYMHGWIYREEYGYSTAFEAYVAQSFYEFLLSYDAGHDRLWIAEHNGKIVGCIGIVSHGERAQLRWFLLHPNYRGIGLGKKLLHGAIDFCRDAGYKNVYLDTTSDLETALGMYERAGFVKVSEKENHAWRDDLTELELAMNL